MGCPAFDVTVKDVKAALAKVKDGIRKEKGSFSGDETKGSFALHGDRMFVGKYTIKGSYTVADNKITITNSITTESPKIVTCQRIEDEIRDWLK